MIAEQFGDEIEMEAITRAAKMGRTDGESADINNLNDKTNNKVNAVWTYFSDQLPPSPSILVV